MKDIERGTVIKTGDLNLNTYSSKTLEEKFTEKIIEMLTKKCKPQELSTALIDVVNDHFRHFTHDGD